MIWFAIGLVIGTAAGICVTALCVVAREADHTITGLLAPGLTDDLPTESEALDFSAVITGSVPRLAKRRELVS